ncbi:hypothetical protein KVR01_012819 [Diaporthe batatas]|uniref:uncharacterized protein n=1 Tax=Diaporthe batatas TaxID=748121 RepID=UPI001D058863|nr:uncharacterized protein KVR01_012819 [Diaporthe batatas]KAG8157435.1 hypothetical protein KVR01_012819 [Diaporthe batatas]
MMVNMEPIAVTGFSFRLAQGAEDEASLWDVLESGRNVMTPYPESRLKNIDAFHEADSDARNNLPSTGAHFLKGDPAAFDAPFFSITSKEAAAMDPAQRMLLETAYRALENAGIPLEHVAGTNTAVFSGSMIEDYMRITVKCPDEAPTHMTTGTSPALLANRLGWFFDLRGPNVQVDTACSSSMTATHLACQSLQRGEASMALVTGSNLILSAEMSMYLGNLNLLSKDSLSYSFDERANGYARGEGIVVLVMKRLSDAIRDRDVIRGIIRATGANSDGRTPSVTQPSVTAQEELIRGIHHRYNLGLEPTRYVEAHGTGTQLGDTTEMKALGRVFKSTRSRKEPLFVGSLKANFGHTEGASGLASILKCIMILEKGIIPPNALLEKLNPKIPSRLGIIQVPTKCITWPSDGLRRVLINSFGFGGSNAHAIMDDVRNTLESLATNEARRALTILPLPSPTQNGNGIPNGDGIPNGHQIPSGDETPVCANGTSPLSVNCSQKPIPKGIARAKSENEAANHVRSYHTHSKYELLVWSARDEAALTTILQDHERYFAANIHGPGHRLEQFAYTLAARRSVMNWRCFAVVGMDDINEGPARFRLSKQVRVSREKAVAFVLTGQGAQYARMGLELLRYPVFQSSLIRANKVFSEMGSGWSVIDELQQGTQLHTPGISQPLCTALQLALIDLLDTIGLIPQVVVGHSSGEIAAAYSAGALSFESACKVAFHRGRLTEQLVESMREDPGAMMSVNIPEAHVDSYLERAGLEVRPSARVIHVACINSPTNVTLSGNEKAIDGLKICLDNDGIFNQKLNTGVAYHSPAMQAIAEEYLASIDSLKARPSACKTANFMVSSVTGQSISPTSLSDGQYWVDNLVSPVRFADALQYIVLGATKMDHGLKTVTDFLEVGPHAALRRPVQDTLKQAIGSASFRYASLLSRFESPVKSMLNVIGSLFTHGYPVSIMTAMQKAEDSETHPAYLSDLPQYPFDHSRLYWHESRISRDWRFRAAVPRTVLGTQSPDWNPLLPRWRKLLSVEDMPWIADHVIDSSILFPAAGSIMMALEAVKQMANPHKHILGYFVKEASFTSPIIVHRDRTTEVTTALRPLSEAYEKTSQRFQVQLLAYIDTFWSECFNATIHIQYEDPHTEVDGGQEAEHETQRLTQRYMQAKDGSTRHIDKRRFYQWLDEQGLKYGKQFSLADDVYWDGHAQSLAKVNVEPPMEAYAGTVHPAVFDAACQVCYVAPSGGMSESLPVIVPHRMRSTWISAKGWQYPETKQIRVATESRLKTVGSGIQASAVILGDDGSPLCYVDDFELSPVLSSDASDSAKKAKSLHRIEWKPQLSLLGSDALQTYCGGRSSGGEDGPADEELSKLRKRLQSIVQVNAPKLRDLDLSTLPLHIQKYVLWVLSQDESFQDSAVATLAEPSPNLIPEDLLKRPSWRIFSEISQYLADIIDGTCDSNAQLPSLPAIQDFHQSLLARVCDARLARFLDLLVHQSPGLKILEIGSGGDLRAINGFLLSALTEVERRTGGVAFAEYVYTDASAECLDQALDSLKDHKDRVVCKTLDFNGDTPEQGFEAGSFDLIVACYLSRTASNLSATLRNIRRVLKPEGHLLLFDITATDPLITNFAFGVLPRWWSSENEKTHFERPSMTDAHWHSLLQANGFSGNDLVIRDYEPDPAHHASVILSTAIDAPTTSQSVTQGRALLVVDDDNEFQRSVATTLATDISASSGRQTHIYPVTACGEAKVVGSDSVVFLADMGSPFLANVPEPTFDLVRSWVHQASNLLWVASGDIQDTSSSASQFAHSGLKDGFLRTLRTEFGDKLIVNLSLEELGQNEGSAASAARQIAKIWDCAFIAAAPSASPSAEIQYRIQNGEFLVPRLVEDINMSRELASCTQPETRTEPWLPGPPLRLDMGMRGQLETLRFEEDTEYHSAPLAPGDVEIEARAWAVNFRDMFGALGRLEHEAFSFGTDCAGVVTRVGRGCSKVKPGDRVCMFLFGCMRMYPRAVERHIVPIDDSLSFEEACAVINPALTAWQALMEAARIRAGDKVLIHAASGATGQLAVQVAQLAGAEVFATVGYDHKKKLLIEQYGIPEDHIFYSRNTSFASGIKRVTGGYGVDVVLNSLVGEGLRASWECIAPYGRFIEIGKADINANSSLPMGQFAKNVMFCAVDLGHISNDTGSRELASSLLEKVMSLAADGSIYYPRPLHVFDVGAVEDAFRHFQSGHSAGRIVIRVERDIQVQKHLIHQRIWSCKTDASYLVVGGLGGIGRSILRWLVKRGAKYLIVPSRSGLADSGPATDVVRELREQGTMVVTPKCDASSLDSIACVLDEYGRTMPAVRGCINAAMELNDSIYDNMTHEQWSNTIRSKVPTSWNLHLLLPDVDFFIMLSSVAGILGHSGQANYAAGCTFQDALAHYRMYHDQNALSIDLGVMGDIGVVAESEGLQRHFERTQGLDAISENEFLALLDMCCDPARPTIACDASASQLLVGLTTPAERISRMLEPLEPLERPLFSYFKWPRGGAMQNAGSSGGDAVAVAELFRQADSPEDRAAVVVDALVNKLARALTIKPVDLDVTQPLHAFGVDSLIAVELRNWMGKQFAADVPVFEIMGGSTVLAVGELVVKVSHIIRKA